MKHRAGRPYFEETLVATEVRTLLKNPPAGLLGSKVPFNTVTRANYLIDLSVVEKSDLCHDGHGGWQNNSTTTTKTGLLRQYHFIQLTGENRFNRVITTLSQTPAKNTGVALVQYSFRFQEEPIPKKPHGNNKKNDAPPFVPTQPSVRRELNLQARQGMKPGQALGAVQKEHPIDVAESSAEIPRNYRQAEYQRHVVLKDMPSHISASVPKDELFDLMYDMKTAGSDIQKIINTKDSCTIIIASQHQLEILQRAVIMDKAVLNVDSTFNMGKFEVTPLSFINTFLTKTSDGNNPLFMGPVMMHTRKHKATFVEFFRSLQDLVPKLKNSHIILGTDGEAAIFTAAMDILNISAHLRCSMHVRQALQRLTPGCDMYWKGILGHWLNGAYVQGIVDAETEDAMEERLHAAMLTWPEDSNTEKVSAQTTVPTPCSVSNIRNGNEMKDIILVTDNFVCKVTAWVARERQMLWENLSAAVRQRSGIVPPAHFTTQAAESVNNMLKSKRQRTSGSWTSTVAAISEISAQQRYQCLQAMAQASPDFVVDEAAATPDLFRMEPAQRAICLSKVGHLFD